MLQFLVEPERRVRLGHVVLAHAGERALIESSAADRGDMPPDLIRVVLHVIRVVQWVHQVHIRLHTDRLLVLLML